MLFAESRVKKQKLNCVRVLTENVFVCYIGEKWHVWAVFSVKMFLSAQLQLRCENVFNNKSI